MDQRAEILKNFIKENLLVVIVGGIGLILFSIGLMLSLQKEKAEITFYDNKEGLENENKEIIIDVEGAVLKPGIYKLNSQSRIQDALIKAGGLSQDADRVYVSKNINLAKVVSDGEKIYFPKLNDVSQASKTNVIGQSINEEFEKININTSNSKVLSSLPGIGDVTAGKIIDGRPYENVDDLINRKIVSSRVFEMIKDKVAAF